VLASVCALVYCVELVETSNITMFVLLVTKIDTDKKDKFIFAKKQEIEINYMTNIVTPSKIFEAVYKAEGLLTKFSSFLYPHSTSHR
jgi:hypothetical protein